MPSKTLLAMATCDVSELTPLPSPVIGPPSPWKRLLWIEPLVSPPAT
jgi:hypothetical protein